jgi:glycosyltransferase involved in cell wall biosynthesis
MSRDDASKKLSVVVVASNDAVALEKTLASLTGAAKSPDTETIAVCNFDGAVLASLQQKFPFIKTAVLPKDTSVAALRTRGVQLANGEIIAFVEDYGFVDDRWLAEIKKAHDSGFSVVGGAIENKCPNRLLNWAVYFFDYGRYMPPLEAGLTATLSGMNVSYNRKALEKFAETYREGFHETFVHEQLKSSGYELYLAPSAIVYLSKDYKLGATVQSFFALARSFATRRVVYKTRSKRALLALGSCLLPVLLPLRTVLCVLPKKKHLLSLVLCVPHLSVLMTGWAAGEFCGYLFGEAANSTKIV